MTRADQRKFHYIYKITRNDGSGKYYIGMHSTDDLEDGYFGSGQLLWKSIAKHGKEIHSKEILEFLPTRQELKTRERELVNEEIVNDPLCMNLKLGGGGGWDHIGNEQRRRAQDAGRLAQVHAGISAQLHKTAHSETANAKRVQTNLERYQTTYGKKPPCHTGLKRTDETKSRLSVSQSGEKNSQFGSCWVTNGAPIKIKKEELDAYLAIGYRRGRK